MKQQLLATALLASALGIHATTWNLQGREYAVDTVFHASIGPGTMQTSIRLSTATTGLDIFYTTTDLTNPYVDLRVTKGGGAVAGVATLSSQCSKASREGARYFAGVNADFFGGNVACGAVVVDSDPLYVVNNGWDCWYKTDRQEVGLGRVIFTGTATCGSASHRVTSVNGSRGENALVIYTPRKGTTTGTNAYGYEVAVKLIDGAVGYRSTGRLEVVGTPESAGNMRIADMVLSGHGTGAAFVSALKAGDIIDVAFTSEYPSEGFVDQMVGGLPMILSDGKVLETMDAIDHLSSNHPRTAIGHDTTGKKVYMVVVDGRSPRSAGCTTKVLADIMKNIGCSEALNFDGGGSSELYTTSLGIRNNPSDGTERAVCNAVWSVSTAPTDNEIASIAFRNHRIYPIARCARFEPVIYAYNKYGMLIDTSLSDYTLSCPSELGTITDDGHTLVATGTGTHTLTATCGSVKATITVSIAETEPQFETKELLIDNYHTYRINVGAPVDGERMLIDNASISWASSMPNIATVDTEGIVRGIAEGSATISGAVGDLKDELEVTVEIPAARYMPVFPDLNSAGFKLSQAGVSGQSMADTPEGLVLNYTIKDTRNTYLNLGRAATLFSLPDSIRVVVETTGKINAISASLAPRGAKAVIKTFDTTAGAKVLSIPLDAYADISTPLPYPFSLNWIRFYLDDAKTESHSIVVREISAVYPHLKADASAPAPAVDRQSQGTVFAAPGENLSDPGTAVYTLSGALVSRGVAPSYSGIFVAVSDSGAVKLVVR